MANQDAAHLELGRAGERVAERYLKRQGLKLICRGFCTPVGELDLIMRAGETLVFVEVKTRRDRIFADPEDAVGPTKVRRLMRAAHWYLHQKRWEDRPCRFDVLAVVLAPGTDPDVRHYPDAFAP
jgi:putative endonuclease